MHCQMTITPGRTLNRIPHRRACTLHDGRSTHSVHHAEAKKQRRRGEVEQEKRRRRDSSWWPRELPASRSCLRFLFMYTNCFFAIFGRILIIPNLRSYMGVSDKGSWPTGHVRQSGNGTSPCLGNPWSCSDSNSRSNGGRWGVFTIAVFQVAHRANKAVVRISGVAWYRVSQSHADRFNDGEHIELEKARGGHPRQITPNIL